MADGLKGAAATRWRKLLVLAQRFPGVEESTSYNTPALKVKGRLIARLRSEAEGALALYCDFVDREMLLQAAPDAFFITDHYANYPMILVRLDKVLPSALPELIEKAWRMRAPAKLVAEFDRADLAS
ncbi:MmcQ/YjbR family DNA-binding protein [Hydrocarboniphaga sp.]|uniref:MmcQ/YjbR family DNA-binding protein n=1 Tax=Hydrocarboniphaga sp. TaxID=2033016 RepID=UPI003D0E4358